MAKIRMAAGAVAVAGGLLLFGACTPNGADDFGDADSTYYPDSTSYTEYGHEHVYPEPDGSYEPESEASIDPDGGYPESDPSSEYDGQDTGGYVGSSEWVLDQSERDMWRSYGDRINSW